MLYRPKVLWLETALREAAKKQEAMDQLKRHATELEAQGASLTDKLASEQERHQTLLDKEKHQGKCGPFIRSPLCAAMMCCSSDLAYQLPQTWPLLGSATACRQE